MTRQIEPLASELWFQRIEKIANGEMASVEHALRHASHLLQLTPAPFREVVRLAIAEDRFEALLDDGDFDTAARHLVGQPTVLALEIDRDEKRVRATISCSILSRTIPGIGDTVPSAVLDAWTTCLLGLRTAYGEDLLSGPDQLEHICPRGRDRRLS